VLLDPAAHLEPETADPLTSECARKLANFFSEPFSVRRRGPIDQARMWASPRR